MRKKAIYVEYIYIYIYLRKMLEKRNLELCHVCSKSFAPSDSWSKSFEKQRNVFQERRLIRLPQEIFSRKYEKYEKEEQCYIKHLLHLIVYLLTFLSSFSISIHDSTSWLGNYGYIKWYLNVILYVLFLILIPDTVW